jgi:hypothetical protein
MTSSDRTDLIAALMWLLLGIASAALLVDGRDPAPLVAAGAVAALVARERDRPGWAGFISTALLRVGDATLLGGTAWYLADHQSTPRGAATACAVLALALLASYVRVRALSLGIGAGALARGASIERGVWLGLVAIALWAERPGSPEVLVGGLAFAGAWSALLAAIRAGRIWRRAPRA